MATRVHVSFNSQHTDRRNHFPAVIHNPMEISIATWNVLADCYAHGHGSQNSWPYRRSLLDKCISLCTADVFCLQEVDHFDDFYLSCFETYGFKAVYFQRPTRRDGCLVAFKTAKYRLISVDQVSCDDGISADSLFEFQKFEKHNVGLTVKLEDVHSKQTFLVATCHVHWNPSLPEVKLSQALYLLQRLWAFRDGEDLPLLLTGDFNALPEDPVYAGITQPHSIRAIAASLHHLKYGGALYGPKTRFLCDASLTKLCKWLRVLGVNVALDAWDNGVPASSSKHKNKAKWQWSSCSPAEKGTIDAASVANDAAEGNTTPAEPSQPTAEAGTTKAPTAVELSYAARVTSINAFFARAEREKRVILTTSKTLRERASCPRNFYVNPQALEQGLVDIAAQFGLQLSRDRFLTVCGKCGDEVEEVSAQDPRLVHRYLPSDRPVYACVNCAQPYWWNEKAGSLPAKAMEKAEQLFQIVTEGLRRQQEEGDTQLDPSVFSFGADKPKVRAGTCILKDFGRTAKNPVLKDATRTAASNSKVAEWELQQQRLELEALQLLDTERGEDRDEGDDDDEEAGDEEQEDDEVEGGNGNSSSPSPPADLSTPEPSSGSTSSMGESSASQAISLVSTPTIEAAAAACGTTSNAGGLTMTELSALFEIRKRSLQAQTGGATETDKETESGKGASTKESQQQQEQEQEKQQVGSEEGGPRLGLRSVFEQETQVTNWNGDFLGTLDYVFASPHWTVRAPTTVLPAVDTAQALPTVPGTLSHGRAIVPILLSAVETEAATGDQEGRVFAPAVFQQVLQGPQPSLQWPSDHFMVFATLALPSCSL